MEGRRDGGKTAQLNRGALVVSTPGQRMRVQRADVAPDWERWNIRGVDRVLEPRRRIRGGVRSCYLRTPPRRGQDDRAVIPPPCLSVSLSLCLSVSPSPRLSITLSISVSKVPKIPQLEIRFAIAYSVRLILH
jgi:hypothetical protein